MFNKAMELTGTGILFVTSRRLWKVLEQKATILSFTV